MVDNVIDVGVSVESSLTMPATEPMCVQAINPNSALAAEMSCTDSSEDYNSFM